MDWNSYSEIVNYRFKDINYNVLLVASERFKELRFSAIKSKYPHLKSLKEFLTSEDYLGNSSVEIKYFTEEVSGRDLYNACVRAFEKVSSYIISLKPEFIGSTEFKPKAIKSVIKEWKEDFLNEIADKHYISKTLISGNEYKIIGLPFYNEQHRRVTFLEEVSTWIGTI